MTPLALAATLVADGVGVIADSHVIDAPVVQAPSTHPILQAGAESPPFARLTSKNTGRVERRAIPSQERSAERFRALSTRSGTGQPWPSMSSKTPTPH